MRRLRLLLGLQVQVLSDLMVGGSTGRAKNQTAAAILITGTLTTMPILPTSKGSAFFMSKFNSPSTRTATGRGPVLAESSPSGVTHEGGPGFARDSRSELFLLAVSNMVGEGTFYEKAGDRDNRYGQLVRKVAVEDPTWTGGFLRWLRGDGNMRSASMVGALEAARAMVAAKIPGARKIVASVLQRADEPGEALAYWMSQYGRAIPMPVKRGIADAAKRLYTEYALLKYDTGSHGFRFADVLELAHVTGTHPDIKGTWQGELFQFAVDRRHDHDGGVPATLPMIAANRRLRALAGDNPSWLTNPQLLKEAGMTWEDALSLAGPGVDKAKLWSALIPSMGYMALLRNLRNLDQAGVPDDVAEQVAKRLADPEQVAKSRQFPFRFLAAYENAPSLRWSLPLDRALTASLSNLPALPGRSLVLIDTSASMTSQRISAKSTMTAAKAAAVFGVALAAKCGADLYGWADGQFRHDVPKGGSVIREVDRFLKRIGEVGHGTRMSDAIRATYRNHDRVFIISDMQTMGGYYAGGVTEAVPRTIPLYGFNLNGYERTAFDAGNPNRIEFGGLTDATFRMVPTLEAGKAGTWPWIEVDN